MSVSPRTPWSSGALTFGICLLLGAALSLTLGQDIEWDLKNYHVYNAWALLSGHFSQDIAPAGKQSYFNPLPDLPYYILGRGMLCDWPRLLAALQGCWFGGLLYILLGIASRLATYRNRSFGLPDLFGVLIGASGTIIVTQVGTVTNEVPLAVLVLLGFYLLMPLYSAGATQRPLRRALIAGLCCGLAAGLKPTAVIYPPAMTLALLLTLRPRVQSLKLATSYLVGVVLAFVLSYGWWGWRLYELTGNPVFPMFNQVFKSGLAALSDATDAHFRPRDLVQWLFYPFFWLRKNSSLVTETGFADWRFAIAMIALLVMAWFRFAEPSRPPKQASDVTRLIASTSTTSVAAFLTAFVCVAYVVWLVLFSILRYAIPIEALIGLLILLALQTSTAKWWSEPRAIQRGSYVMGALGIFFVATSLYPSYGRTAFGKHVFDVGPIQVEPGSTVVFVGDPNAYLAAFFAHSENIDFVGLTPFTHDSEGYGLWALTRERIVSRKDSLYAVRREDPRNQSDLLFSFLPGYQYSDCQPIHSNLEYGKRGNDYSMGLSLCRVTRS